MAVVPPRTTGRGSSRDTPLQLAREAFGSLLVEDLCHLVGGRPDAGLVFGDLLGPELLALALEQLEEPADDGQRRAQVVHERAQALLGVRHAFSRGHRSL